MVKKKKQSSISIENNSVLSYKMNDYGCTIEELHYLIEFVRQNAKSLATEKIFHDFYILSNFEVFLSENHTILDNEIIHHN